MNIRSDKDVIEFRDQSLKTYSVRDNKLDLGQKLALTYRVIGSSEFSTLVNYQLKNIISNSDQGKILLIELSKLPVKFDIVEFSVSHAASYGGNIVVLHNATTPQGEGKARFESTKGTPLRGSFLPSMTLAHELFHVGQLQKAKFFEPYCNWICNVTGGPWKLPKKAFESAAVKYTNQIRVDRELGYVRTYYSGYGGTKIDTYKKAAERPK